MNDENVVEKAEVVLAVRDYETRDVRKKEKLVDFTVSPQKSDDKILVRVIVETASKSGYIGVYSVKKMSDLLKEKKL